MSDAPPHELRGSVRVSRVHHEDTIGGVLRNAKAVESRMVEPITPDFAKNPA